MDRLGLVQGLAVAVAETDPCHALMTSSRLQQVHSVWVSEHRALLWIIASQATSAVNLVYTQGQEVPRRNHTGRLTCGTRSWSGHRRRGSGEGVPVVCRRSCWCSW